MRKKIKNSLQNSISLLSFSLQFPTTGLLYLSSFVAQNVQFMGD